MKNLEMLIQQTINKGDFMSYIEEKTKFLENKNALRKNFGVLSDLIAPFLNEIGKINQTYEQRVFERLKTVKFKFGNKEMNASGLAKRTNANGKVYSSIVVDSADFDDINDVDKKVRLRNGLEYFFNLDDSADLNNPNNIITRIAKGDSDVILTLLDKQEVENSPQGNEWKELAEIYEKSNEYLKIFRRQTALHELIHSIAECKCYCIPKNSTFCDVREMLEQKIDAKPNMKNFLLYDIAQVMGNVSLVSRTMLDNGQNIINHNSLIAELKEESIVEDWTIDLTSNLNFMTADSKEYYAVNEPQYSPIRQIAGMWNAISDNELRKQFLDSKVDTPYTEATMIFHRLYTNFLNSFVNDKCNDTQQKVDIKTFSPQQIAKTLNDLLEFCDLNFDDNLYSKQLTPENVSKYLENRNDIFDVNKYLEIMSDYVIFNEADFKNFANTLNQCFVPLRNSSKLFYEMMQQTYTNQNKDLENNAQNVENKDIVNIYNTTSSQQTEEIPSLKR